MLVGLGHGTVGCCYYEDSSVHLGGTGNHVLHVVGVARAIDMRIVTIGGLILDVCGVDGDTALLLLGSVVDLIERLDFAQTLGCQHLGDGGGKGGLTVVNMANCTDVNVGFSPFENFFCHNITYKSCCKNKPALGPAPGADDGI